VRAGISHEIIYLLTYRYRVNTKFIENVQSSTSNQQFSHFSACKSA